MPHTTRTLALGVDWDIGLSGTGKILLHDSAMATAQAVANEIRRFVNDTYFDYDIGVPHFDIELGHPLPEARFKSALRQAAYRVDDVAEIISVTIHSIDRETRLLTGEIQFTTVAGLSMTVVL